MGASPPAAPGGSPRSRNRRRQRCTSTSTCSADSPATCSSLDAGLVSAEPIEQALSSLDVGDIEIAAERNRRGAILGTHVEFAGWPPEAESDHRHLSTIEQLLDDSDLPADVTDRAIAMFRRLGRAESDVHGIPLEDVHFHECGALDSIFDFVSAAWIVERTGVDSWSCGPVPLGSGTVETDHGTVPLPVPATAKLLTGFETVTREVPAELVTPTGATILQTLRATSPEMRRVDGEILRDGYGAGTRELAAFSNVTRMLVIDPAESPSEHDDPSDREEIVRLTTEIDDMSAEQLADVEEVLFEAGDLDVVRESVAMKKGRQGTRLAVLGTPDDARRLADLLFRHTTTFGIRRARTARWTLERRKATVETAFDPVGIKLGYRDGELLQTSPEFEDCRTVAREHGVPVRRVYEAAVAAADDQFED
ncbi:MAG: nickel pincer cofactor biosynthesis protein LarC [Bradymonadaceae bacterium]